MIQKKLVLLLIITTIISSSCTDDEMNTTPEDLSTGQVRIHFTGDTSIDGQLFEVLVLKPNSTEPNKTLSNLTKIPEYLEFDEGTFEIEVQSQNSDPITVEDIIFNGKSNPFQVKPGDTLDIDINITIDDFQGWVKVPNVPVEHKYGASSFMIGDNIYLGLGASSSNAFTSDWWKYSVSTNEWTQLDDFPNGPRGYVLSFSNSDKGYLCLGSSEDSEDISGYISEFWEFEPINGTWTQLKDFPGAGRGSSVAMITESTVYIGSGIRDGVNSLSDFYSYDFQEHEWDGIASFTGPATYGSSSFTVNNEVHLLAGIINSNERTSLHFVYNSIDNDWVELPSFPGNERLEGATFNINGIGYFGLGSISNQEPGVDLWKFDPFDDSWKKVSNFIGPPRFAPIYGSNGKIGYYGFGAGLEQYNDLYLYYPE